MRPARKGLYKIDGMHVGFFRVVTASAHTSCACSVGKFPARAGKEVGQERPGKLGGLKGGAR